MHARKPEDCQAQNASAAFRHIPMLLALTAAGLMSACGGGGGGVSAASNSSVQSESPQGTPGATGPAIDPVTAQADAFLFNVDGSQTTSTALAQSTGGSTHASWNPVGGAQFFAPGLKVSFFGDPQGCATGTKSGRVKSTTANQIQYNTSLTGIAASVDELSWVPSGDSQGCSGVNDRDGPSAVYLNPDASTGGLAMFTSAGPRGDGKASFFSTFGTAGQNGLGTNANITGTYVAFRQIWRQNATVRPWRGSAVNARIVVNQGVGATELGPAFGQTAQVQQLVNVHFINTTCERTGITSARPCQLNYLFNTLIQRNNVTDWRTVGWAQTVRVWYDAAQGGIPIIEGPLKAAGISSTESNTGYSMFTSKGYETQHTAFSHRSFDVRISLAQLTNALRILTARQASVDVTRVTDNDIASMWGIDWNNPDAWVAESVTTAQEISNPDTSRTAWIAGSVRQVYVGPAGS